MERNIAELERRYQALLGDYRSGKIDESAFTAEIDKLQFQDNLGRYWMIGAQTGAWHYYDGQNWRQADPNEADKLPFMDAQGRYWQRGAKSGDWYYYQPETNEWVKPGQNDPTGPAVSQPQPQPQPQPTAYAQQPAQSDTELFQDDEGRYWSLGAKSGQWYFYDHEGWHPASEFEVRTGRVQPQPFQQPSMPAQGYPGYAQPAYPAQNYPPQQPAPHSAEPQPAYFTPQPGPAPAAQAPGQTGSWFYFDGKQWLQYSTGEPAKDAPPDPALIVDQDTKEPAARAKKAEPKAEPVVAEYIEEDEPPVEVVDVEVITVYEAEPDSQPQPAAVQPEPAPQPKPAPATIPIPVTPRRQPIVEEEPVPAATARTATSPLSPDEVVPRREKSSPELPASGQRQTPLQDNQVVPQRRTPAAPPPVTTEPSRPGAPRRRSQAAHEPTIIIPTGSTTSTPAAARTARPSPPPVAPTPAQQKRAREDTMPMEPIKKPEPAAPAASGARHHQVTQPLPVIPRTAQPSAEEPSQSQREQRARQKTAENIAPPVAPVKPVEPKQAGDKDKEGYTLGDILRAFPSTLWTGVAGVAVLVIFAFIIIAVFMYGSGVLGAGNVAQVQLPTPTLPAGPPDETPTPGPTPTGNSAAQPVATPTPATMAKYSSQDLEITLEYPDTWKTAENGGAAIFAPTAAGLDPKALAETKMLIGQPEKIDAPIADILSGVLGQFPPQAETLNEGTISIGSQTWTSTQIRFEDAAENKQGIATIAVTSKDGTGYYLVASSLAQDWNSVQPVFQGMINSFRFGAEKIVAKAETPKATTTSATPNAGTAATTDDAAKTTPTPESTPTPAPTVSLTPVVYAIQSGDTLLAIANKFGVDVDLLASENGIDNPESLQIGQELTIPFTAEELAAYNSTGKAATSNKTTAASTAQATRPADTTTASTEAQPAAAAAATATPAPEAAAAPVSGRIVYPAFNNGTGVYDIWMVNLATGEQTPIAGSASQPAFNKDGSLLAYRSWDRGTRGIFFRDFIGGRGDIVTKFVEDGLPAWSPDGLNFVFSSRKEGDRVPRIYIGNQMGETPFAVGFQGEYPSVMPDSRLVVKGCTPSGDCGLFMLGPRGGGEKKLSDLPSDTAPAPSPDGSKIAFMSYDRGGAGNWEVWIMNSDGSNMQRLTENASADGLPAWSPDGGSIAFVSNRDGVWATWVMNADGSNQRKLFDMKGPPDGKVLYDDFNSRGWLEERISWAP